MNLKFKSTLIIIFTLVIGMFIGFLITPVFRPKDRFRDRIAELRTPDGFIERFERIIEPDESQREAVRDILSNHFDRIHRYSISFRERFTAMHDSLKMELQPFLNPDQIERLDSIIKRMERFGKPGPPEFHRPPRNRIGDRDSIP